MRRAHVEVRDQRERSSGAEGIEREVLARGIREQARAAHEVKSLSEVEVEAGPARHPGRRDDEHTDVRSCAGLGEEDLGRGRDEGAHARRRRICEDGRHALADDRRRRSVGRRIGQEQDVLSRLRDARCECRVVRSPTGLTLDDPGAGCGVPARQRERHPAGEVARRAERQGGWRSECRAARRDVQRCDGRPAEGEPRGQSLRGHGGQPERLIRRQGARGYTETRIARLARRRAARHR